VSSTAADVPSDQERRHLAQANRHIAEVKLHIARQRKAIEKLKAGNHSTEIAESMLIALEESLRAFERHRQLILALLQDAHK
jgi:hypothetical protein